MKANNCQNLGCTLELQGHFSKSLQWYAKAVELGKSYNLEEILFPCSAALVGLYWRAALHQKALSSAQSTLKAAATPSQIIEAKILLAKAHFALDDVQVGKGILKKLRKQSLVGKTAPYLEEVDALLRPGK
jgi:hypothetical protein